MGLELEGSEQERNGWGQGEGQVGTGHLLPDQGLECLFPRNSEAMTSIATDVPLAPGSPKTPAAVAATRSGHGGRGAL